MHMSSNTHFQEAQKIFKFIFAEDIRTFPLLFGHWLPSWGELLAFYLHSSSLFHKGNTIDFSNLPHYSQVIVRFLMYKFPVKF